VNASRIWWALLVLIGCRCISTRRQPASSRLAVTIHSPTLIIHPPRTIHPSPSQAAVRLRPSGAQHRAGADGLRLPDPAAVNPGRLHALRCESHVNSSALLIIQWPVGDAVACCPWAEPRLTFGRLDSSAATANSPNARNRSNVFADLSFNPKHRNFNFYKPAPTHEPVVLQFHQQTKPQRSERTVLPQQQAAAARNHGSKASSDQSKESTRRGRSSRAQAAEDRPERCSSGEA